MKAWRKEAQYWNALESEKQGKRVTHQGRKNKGQPKLSKEERESYVKGSEEAGNEE